MQSHLEFRFSKIQPMLPLTNGNYLCTLFYFKRYFSNLYCKNKITYLRKRTDQNVKEKETQSRKITGDTIAKVGNKYQRGTNVIPADTNDITSPPSLTKEYIINPDYSNPDIVIYFNVKLESLSHERRTLNAISTTDHYWKTLLYLVGSAFGPVTVSVS
ncbi:hypothetical protein PUN28_002024 [Cardiocondyla obscurior]|uniref:Uncharacterized protein n=1 Tax=Cardiocondyla obscurior TaxID=286306 RepID=A0AAW2GSF8_9HYME